MHRNVIIAAAGTLASIVVGGGSAMAVLDRTSPTAAEVQPSPTPTTEQGQVGEQGQANQQGEQGKIGEQSQVGEQAQANHIGDGGTSAQVNGR